VCVGDELGALVGAEVGAAVVGVAVGSDVGAEVGTAVVGVAVGSDVGAEVGAVVVGVVVGAAVGPHVRGAPVSFATASMMMVEAVDPTVRSSKKQLRVLAVVVMIHAEVEFLAHALASSAMATEVTLIRGNVPSSALGGGTTNVTRGEAAS
jgi:hypothetical protein